MSENKTRNCPKCNQCTLGEKVSDGKITGKAVNNDHLIDEPDGTLRTRCPHCGAGLRLDATRMIILESTTREEADAFYQKIIDEKRQRERLAELARLAEIAEAKRQEEQRAQEERERLAAIEAMREQVTITSADVGEVPADLLEPES